MTKPEHYAMFEPPQLSPVIVIESSAQGWRGLTQDGQILNVESQNGIPFGGSLAVKVGDRPVGYRDIPKLPAPGKIDSYERCFNTARRALKAGRMDLALSAIDTALSFAPTLTARYNKGMILLEMGRWQEGFEEYEAATEAADAQFMRPQYRACLDYGLKRWRGEDIAGKRLLLIHDHGFGDSIMMLRYVHVIQAMGADVKLWLPNELLRLASPLAWITDHIIEADYFCPLLFLLPMLGQTPATIPLQPYLQVDPALVDLWRMRLGFGNNLVGVAWQPGKTHDGDYPRSIPLEMLKRALPDADLISVQQHGAEEAAACGVQHFPFDDFADCAALMSCCDRIITVDTAAVHLAGAVGHPRISLLLGHWASWRWLSPLYQNICVYRQARPDDWDSILRLL